MTHYAASKRRITLAAAAVVAVNIAAANTVFAQTAAVVPSGVDLLARDTRVRPGDDFFRFALGTWYAAAKIPADQSEVGIDSEVSAKVREQLRAIIEGSVQRDDNPEKALIGGLYSSFMNEALLEKLGMSPLRADLDRIAQAASKMQFLKLMASSLSDFGISVFSLRIGPDAKSPIDVLYIGQAGLGLDTPDYYLAPGFAKQKSAYRDYIARTLSLVGYGSHESAAAAIVEFETDIAKASWSQTKRRDIAALYNPTSLASLQRAAPGIAWRQFLSESGIPSAAPIVLAEKSAVVAIADLYARTSLEVLKAWQAFHTIDNASRFLSRQFVENRFAFHGTALTGATEIPARWKRGVNLVDARLGQALGHLYVAAHFSPAAKQQMEVLVERLREAMAKRIASLDWMSEPTKREALSKLAAMRVFVGYPSHWRNYGGLKMDAADLYGNVRRGMASDWSFQCASLGKPLDKDAWGPFDFGITPQTVDAFNIAAENLIIFPAALLQPPYFNPQTDVAHNYGAIGAVIGHEITHGFDDQGRKIDANGKLRDWWSADDNHRFEQRAARLARQYDAIEVLPGVHVSGNQTLGEDIADLGGLLLALDAYHAQLNGMPAPMLDGLSAEQRVFFGWAQRWRRKIRDDALRDQISMEFTRPRPRAPMRRCATSMPGMRRSTFSPSTRTISRHPNACAFGNGGTLKVQFKIRDDRWVVRDRIALLAMTFAITFREASTTSATDSGSGPPCRHRQYAPHSRPRVKWTLV